MEYMFPGGIENQTQALLRKYEEGLFTKATLYLLLTIRLLLLIVTQLVIFNIIKNGEESWSRAGSFWPYIFGLVVTPVCLILLYVSCNKEGISISDLFEKDIKTSSLLVKTLLLTLSMAIIASPTYFLFGDYTVPTVIQSFWPAWWMLMFVTLIVEDMVYRGYVLPRLEVIYNNKTTAILLVAFFFALQHIAGPIIDATHSIQMVVGAFLIGLVLNVFYLKTRQLAPVILAHLIQNLPFWVMLTWQY